MLVKKILELGGMIKPLIVPKKGVALMNPSVFVDDGRIMVNIRNTNYTLYHSEFTGKYQSRWGRLAYLNPENDIKLKTTNIIAHLNDDLEITGSHHVDTSKLDSPEPKWEFHGLEDARLFKWGEKYFLCGVRRDTTDNGEGRMELSEISPSGIELSRERIPLPNEGKSYCEKNWMPILNKPYHFVKWTNPTEIVKYNPINKTTKQVLLTGTQSAGLHCKRDIRGGSQVIFHDNHYIAITHEVDLFTCEVGRKDGNYYHRFVKWDDKFNLVSVSPEFRFMDASIEFCTGFAIHEGTAYISFGFQDNAAFILKFQYDEKIFESPWTN